MADLPIKFEEKAKLPPSAGGTGYPYRISATDLDKNFAYAALDAADGWIEEASVGSHSGRKLKLPPLTGKGTHVLSCVNGNLEWMKFNAVEVQYVKDNAPAVGKFIDTSESPTYP